MSVPTLLTLTRIALIPLLVAITLASEAFWASALASAVFVIAAITDALDGYLARRLKQATLFGAFLDPVADKLLVIAALVVLVYRYNSLWLTVPALVIISREVIVSALREWMAETRKSHSVLSNLLGKWKTFLQLTAIALLLGGTTPEQQLASHHPFVQQLSQWVIWLGYPILYLAVVLTILSMLNYLKSAWPVLQSGLQQKKQVETDESPIMATLKRTNLAE